MHAVQHVPNLRHLRALSLTARHRSVKRAAAEICLSQPAVTQAIAKLERDCGESFFQRAPTGMYCTEFGRLFVHRVDRALAILGQAAADAARPHRADGGADRIRKVTAPHLRAMIAIAGHGSFAAAAHALGISQPSMQRTAMALEHALKAKLFLRKGSGVVLSPAGESFARGVNLAVREIETGMEEIENLRGYKTGRIVVGSMPLARVDLVPRAITRLLRRYPDLRIRIVEGAYATLMSGLRAGEVDIVVGALREPAPYGDVEERRLFDDALSVVVRSGHPLARQRTVPIADTIGYPWIVPCSGTPTRELFHEAFRSRALKEPKRLLEVSSNVSLRALLLESDRITLVSRRQISHEERSGLLVALPIELPEAHRPIGVTVRRDWAPSNAQAELLEELRQVVADEESEEQGREAAAGKKVRRTRTGTVRAPG